MARAVGVATSINAGFRLSLRLRECVNEQMERVSSSGSVLNRLAKYARRNAFLAVSEPPYRHLYEALLVQLRLVLLILYALAGRNTTRVCQTCAIHSRGSRA